MSDKAENPRAFPYVVPTDFGFAHPGMELRDWFAGQAIAAGLVSRGDDARAILVAVEKAYLIADAMLQEREKG